MFRQDRERGGLYCLRARAGADGRPAVVTQLGARLAASGADWASWAKSLAALLELLEDEMPTLPLRRSAEEDLHHRAPSLASGQGPTHAPALPDCWRRVSPGRVLWGQMAGAMAYDASPVNTIC